MNKGYTNGTDMRRVRVWAFLCLTNLAVVALLGVLLRYKIAWSLPVLDYKFLLNAHSHFAFNGWVTTVLFTGFLYVLSRSGQPLSKTYGYQFWLNQVASYGMLVSFTWEGYGGVSIFFSALSVLFSYWFAYRIGKDMNGIKLSWQVMACMRAALFFLVLSSVGPFLLAYGMSHPIGGMTFYYNAIYLYLHFQYNGWFTFGVLALFFFSVRRYGIKLPERQCRWFVGLMVGACVPAYTLSLLWTDPAGWVWTVAATAGIAQWIGLLLLTRMLWHSRKPFGAMPHPVKALWAMTYIAFGIKIKLQALSVIPFFGHLAFGYRPVIIAYLHLVMLCFVSFFIMGFLIKEGILHLHRTGGTLGLGLWVTGVTGNEVFLLIQSLLALTGHSCYDGPFYLFGIALTILAGMLVVLASRSGHFYRKDRRICRVADRIAPSGST
jgi:hypothetical protein